MLKRAKWNKKLNREKTKNKQHENWKYLNSR